MQTVSHTLLFGIAKATGSGGVHRQLGQTDSLGMFILTGQLQMCSYNSLPLSQLRQSGSTPHLDNMHQICMAAIRKVRYGCIVFNTCTVFLCTEYTIQIYATSTPGSSRSNQGCYGYYYTIMVKLAFSSCTERQPWWVRITSYSPMALLFNVAWRHLSVEGKCHSYNATGKMALSLNITVGDLNYLPSACVPNSNRKTLK